MYTQTPKTASAPLLGLAFCFSLCACSTTSETFDCPAGKGVGCKSVSEINQMVDSDTRVQGRLGEGDAERGVQSVTPLPAPVISADMRVVNSLSDTMAVHRVQEEHLRVWIAPYQDIQGNLHEGSIVHTVLKPGSWQVRVSDSRAIDPSVSDANIDDANTDDPGTTDPQFSGSEEYP